LYNADFRDVLDDIQEDIIIITKLNDYEDSMGCVARFFGDIVKGINKANGE
jgi:hypothetical protein